MKKLTMTKQCKNCPFKVGCDTSSIPNYSLEQHQDLESTIAKDLRFDNKNLRMMACHKSSEKKPIHCVGWLHNQIGVGNNIPLRIAMMGYENAHLIEVEGEQHQSFYDTIPKTHKS